MTVTGALAAVPPPGCILRQLGGFESNEWVLINRITSKIESYLSALAPDILL